MLRYFLIGKMNLVVTYCVNSKKENGASGNPSAHIYCSSALENSNNNEFPATDDKKLKLM